MGVKITAERDVALLRAAVEFCEDTKELWKVLGAAHRRASGRAVTAREKWTDAVKPYMDIMSAEHLVARNIFGEAMSELIDKVEEADEGIGEEAYRGFSADEKKRAKRRRLVDIAYATPEGVKICAEQDDAIHEADEQFQESTRELWETVGAAWKRARDKANAAWGRWMETSKPFRDAREGKCLAAEMVYAEAIFKLMENIMEEDVE